MIEQQSLSYTEFFSLFSQMICAFAFPTTTNRFSIGEKSLFESKTNFDFVVDFGAIWCQALCESNRSLSEYNFIYYGREFLLQDVH